MNSNFALCYIDSRLMLKLCLNQGSTLSTRTAAPRGQVCFEHSCDGDIGVLTLSDGSIATDRVLMRRMPGHDIRQTDYSSAWKATSSDHDPVFATYEFMAPERPLAGNYRRFVLEIGMMEASNLTTPGAAEMLCQFNFPFLDDLKKGVKFKHSIPMVVRKTQMDPKTVLDILSNA